MENINLIYEGEIDFLSEDEKEKLEEEYGNNPEKYHEMQKIIKRDFSKIRDYIVSNLENNEELMIELSDVIESIEEEFDYGSSFCEDVTDSYLHITISNTYLSFSYDSILEQGKLDTYFKNVIMNRNVKEFYFIDRANKLVKKFEIVGKKVIKKNYKYNDEYCFTEHNEDEIKSSISKLIYM